MDGRSDRLCMEGWLQAAMKQGGHPWGPHKGLNGVVAARGAGGRELGCLLYRAGHDMTECQGLLPAVAVCGQHVGHMMVLCRRSSSASCRCGWLAGGSARQLL
jgi:hypothetical protein